MGSDVLCASTRSLQLQDVSDVAGMSVFEVHVASCQSTQCTTSIFEQVLTQYLMQAATSFECDGCQHHASFHSLENPDEDAVLKKWEEQENSFVLQKQATVGASRKRKRIAAKPHNDDQLSDIVEVVDDTDEVEAEVEEQLQEELVGAKRKRGKK